MGSIIENDVLGNWVFSTETGNETLVNLAAHGVATITIKGDKIKIFQLVNLWEG